MIRRRRENRNFFKIGQKLQLFDKVTNFFCFCYVLSQTHYDVMLKGVENLEIVKGVNFDFIDLLKHNGKKCLLFFDVSYEQTCNSKVFVVIATAVRHGGLSIFSITQNLFHQSKLGQNIELQHTHIVLFKCSSDRKSISTISAQLGLG